MVGIQSVIMDNAHIGKECMIAALSYVKPGFNAPDRSIIAGSPAAVKKTATDQQISWKTEGTAVYQHLTRRCLDTFAECQPRSPGEAHNEQAKLHIKKFKPMT